MNKGFYSFKVKDTDVDGCHVAELLFPVCFGGRRL